MIKLMSFLLENKKSYKGDCRTILDTSSLFSDATEMAQTIETGVSISYQQFLSLVNISHFPFIKQNFEFGQNKNLIWAYDSDSDIHYFFI